MRAAKRLFNDNLNWGLKVTTLPNRPDLLQRESGGEGTGFLATHSIGHRNKEVAFSNAGHLEVVSLAQKVFSPENQEPVFIFQTYQTDIGNC